MKQAWVNKENKEQQEKIEVLVQKIRDGLKAFGRFSDEEVEELIKNALYKIEIIGICNPGSMIVLPSNESPLHQRLCHEDGLLKDAISLARTLPYEDLYCVKRAWYERYLDSEPKHYHGDIIITDPCYVISDDDWDDFCDNDEIERFLPSGIARSTIYGDWSCTTIDVATKNPLGHFCADSGMVAVFDLAEVLARYPDFRDHIEREWTTTLIKDFDGDVWFEVKHNTRNDDFSVHVRGKGKNSKTGEPIEFTTVQTGL